MSAERKQFGEFSAELRGSDADPTIKRVKDMALAMNDTIPEGANVGEVIGALGTLLMHGIISLHHQPADRLKAWDEFSAWHRNELAKASDVMSDG